MRRSCNHCCSEKAISVTYSECVSVALVIQPAMRIYRIMLSFVARTALPQFCKLTQESHDFRGEKFTEHKMCVLIFSIRFVSDIPHSKKNSSRFYHKCTGVFM